MKLDPAEDHGLNYVLVTDGSPKISDSFVRKEDLLEALEAYVVSNLAKHDAQNFLVFEEIVDQLFDLFEENGVITKKETPIAGDYFKFNQQAFGHFRPEFLKSSATHKLAAEIGPRYYPDAFKAIEQDVLAGGHADERTLAGDEQKVESAVASAPNLKVLATEVGKSEFLARVDDAILAIEGAKLSNEQRATALAYLKAAKNLTDQPDPPANLIWQIVSRGSDLAGIASFFLTLVAFFTVAGS